MKKSIKLKALFCGMMFAATLATSSMVSAATQYPPEGGVWNYGINLSGSYSAYLHPNLYHGSTVNHNGNKYASQAPAGSWSNALARGIYAGCAFYYNI
ncbi:lactococcin 972 family bacteriocin [Faecalitalea cylindroides]|uniref:lactococcin 972 family bacteriocin n=1 Tax=Faecalitalea cylindroides TaxID=39483 RepID=UPI0039F4AE35